MTAEFVAVSKIRGGIINSLVPTEECQGHFGQSVRHVLY